MNGADLTVKNVEEKSPVQWLEGQLEFGISKEKLVKLKSWLDPNK